MRKSANVTPVSKKPTDDEIQADKTSGKKLVQARLPFKIIAPGSSPLPVEGAAIESASAATTNTTDARKRKLSYESEENINAENEGVAESKENIGEVVTKKKKTTPAEAEDVVLLSDEEEEVVVAEIVINKKQSNKKSLLNTSSCSATDSPKTPKSTAAAKAQSSNTTPSNNSAGTKLGAKSGSTPKLLIKLPLSGGKKKRRKSMRNSVTNEAALQESSDDIETVAVELNPNKKLKVQKETTGNKSILEENNEKQIDTITLESDDGVDNDNALKEMKTSPSTKTKEGNLKQTPLPKPKETRSNTLKNFLQEKSTVESCEDDKNDEKLTETSATVTDIDADDEAEPIYNINTSDDEAKNSDKPDGEITKKSHLNSPSASSTGKHLSNAGKAKNLTPKQAKLLEQRHKAREEKEQKLQEEKLQKQREKEEKEMARKRERDEKEELRRKEREVKDEVKRKEREEKERKRLAEVEAKNEEKRKRNEAKEEELRKREDDRKRKEQEKEEAELKKKKAAMAFTKFFVAKGSKPNAVEESVLCCNEEDKAPETLAFRPFQIKGDMKLAPICRKTLNLEDRRQFDSLLGLKESSVEDKQLNRSHLYISQLKAGTVQAYKWRRPSTESKVDDSDEIMIIEDDLERAAQTVEETHNPVERLRAKYYKFHENRRPPFRGTWRKKSNNITARRPLGQDKKYFDYEVDSDLEWEEEEPGESLDGSEDEKEKESEDEDYEVDNEWFVPHGHLSEEELQNEDECGMGDDNTREAQKAKLKILQQEFAQEMKKKTEKLKPRLVGCIWVDENGNQPELCPKIIWDTLNLRAMLYNATPLIEEPEQPEKAEPNSPSSIVERTVEKLKPMALTESMVKDLIRLVHGNNHSKQFLIKEFMAHVEAHEESIKNGEVRPPLKSMIRDKMEEFAEWQIVESSKINPKKKKSLKRLCWVVSAETLSKMEMQNLDLINQWQYTLQPKFSQAAEEEPVPETNAIADKNEKTEGTTTETNNKSSAKKSRKKSEITKFTKVLSAEDKVLQLQQSNSPASSKTPTNSKAAANSKTPTSSKTPTTTEAAKKRVPLLMSVARGQQINTPAKNALISKFLKKSAEEKHKTSSSKSAATSDMAVDDDDVVILD